MLNNWCRFSAPEMIIVSSGALNSTHSLETLAIDDDGQWRRFRGQFGSNFFYPDLRFVLHCEEKINKAYEMLGIIRRNFVYLSEEALVLFYKARVRSQLEYANSLWNL